MRPLKLGTGGQGSRLVFFLYIFGACYPLWFEINKYLINEYPYW